MDGEIPLPVVRLPESHTILSALLTFVFPVPAVLPPTTEQILELLSVAQKYEMTTTLTRIRDCASRHNPNFVCAKTALDVYSLAWKYELLEEAIPAAEQTLKAPMTIDNYEDKLDVMPITALCELWYYRVQVLDNLDKSFETEFSKSDVYQNLANIGCVEIDKSGIPLWLGRFLGSVLQNPARLDLITFHLALSSHISSSSGGCEQCVSIPGKTIREFWAALTAFVHENIKKVSLLLYATCDESHIIHRLNWISDSRKTLKVLSM
jgi:hypothetical protein